MTYQGAEKSGGGGGGGMQTNTYMYLICTSGVGRCQKVGGGGTQTRNLFTFGKEPI